MLRSKLIKPQLPIGLPGWKQWCLLALALLAVWEGFTINNRSETRGCGGDFPQFYIAGKIVAEGHCARLYDQSYFRQMQEGMRDDPLRSLYPPTIGLMMAPLGMMSYSHALATWWAIHAVCIFAAAWILRGFMPPVPRWQLTAFLALAAFLPLWIAVGIGHLAPVLLVAVAGGISLHRKGWRGPAGMVLSLLAIKPQLAVGLVLWMIVRRDLRTLLGLATGFVMQAAAVAVVLGPHAWIDFLQAMPGIAAVTRAYRYSPLFEQSAAGIASNLLWMAGWIGTPQVAAMKIVHIVTACLAVVLLCRFTWSLRAGKTGDLPQDAIHREYACGLLFMLLFPPYFLVYDLTLLVVPIVLLWSSSAWRMGVVLFAIMTPVVANLSFTTGFSLTPLAIVATMFVLAVDTRRYEELPTATPSVIPCAG